MKTTTRRIALVLTLLTGSILGGCSGNRAIHIRGIGDICRQNVRIDVVGVDWNEKQQWERWVEKQQGDKTAMQVYWAPGNALREGSLAQGSNQTTEFGPTKPCEVTLKEKGPLWAKWKERGATHFFVMFDTCTDATAWYVCLPLASKAWNGRTRKGTIEVEIRPESVKAVPGPRPERKK
ncbi:MAG: hypothetical protein MUC88_25825 [Planctomycetes bacterium]|jgi:hypothetical protein|nr:hypothetical protein [Planctomycetota bacterium]